MIRKSQTATYLILLLWSLGLIQGCTRSIRSRALISDKSNWTIIEKCGYESCAKLVDFLVGTDLTIRVEPYNDLPHTIRNDIFVIQVWFFPKNKNEIAFDPSSPTVRLSDHKVLKPKGLPCSRTVMDLSHLRSAKGFNGSIPIATNACFYLFFDSRPPTVDEKFLLKLDGIKRRGEAVDVPDILFQKSG